MQAFFFGLGFSSQASASFMRTGGQFANALGTSRQPKGESGVLFFDGTQKGPEIASALAEVTHIIISIAPDESGDLVLRHHRDELMAMPKLEWLCYYSTVGVYGNFGGAWIDETAELVPRNMRSDRRVLAEQEWRDFAAERNVPLTILRLAGIYGPGRSTFDKLRDGSARRVIKPGQVFNRIHVEDIGRVTGLAAEQRLAGTFNLADDEPAPPQDLVVYAAAKMGLAPPPEVDFATAEMTPMQRSFYRDNKRVSNAAIKAALDIELLYPNYRVGLDAIWEQEQ